MGSNVFKSIVVITGRGRLCVCSNLQNVFRSVTSMGVCMKRERAFVEHRRQKILEAIIKNPGIHVEDLVNTFDVSAITIRRDLQHLEDQKLLTRFYGGATPSDKALEIKKDDVISMCRDAIARYAATLVEDTDSLFINTSSTALGMIQYITKQNVTIITNNGRAISSPHPSGVSVILTGGELRYPKEAMVGEFAERNLLKVYAKKTFIGCSGISAEYGMTTANANEVNLNELMISRASQDVYVMADHTKIETRSSFRTCSLEKIGHLITDDKAPKEVLDMYREKGLQVHVVSRQ